MPRDAGYLSAIQAEGTPSMTPLERGPVQAWPPRSPYLTPREVAELIGFSTSTLAHWRVAGKGPGYGPPYVKVMGRIRYPAQELERWMREEGLRRTTAEGPP